MLDAHRGLLAKKYTYPVLVESSQGHNLGNQLQPGATAGAGHTSRWRALRRGSRLRAAHTRLAYRDTTTFRRRVIYALGGTRDARPLGELVCRRLVLPDLAPPPCRASQTVPLEVNLILTRPAVFWMLCEANVSIFGSLQNIKNWRFFVSPFAKTINLQPNRRS